MALRGGVARAAHHPFFRWAGRREEIQETVSVVDILPLIGREAQLSPPGSVEGVPVGHRNLAFAESYRSRYAVRN
jgi:hypothetical protein